MRKLLIVDDDEATRDLFRQRLEDFYEITDTGKPEEALALALQMKPDCILLDLRMPRLSGLELCQTLTSLSFTQQIPIFVITGDPEGKNRQFCLNIGAKEYIEKPVDFQDLKIRLATRLERNQPERRSERRIHLRVSLRLRGIDANGMRFSTVTATENVSASGFLCGLQSPLQEGGVVEVFLLAGQEQFVGRAQVIRPTEQTDSLHHYGFRFINTPKDWLLH